MRRLRSGRPLALELLYLPHWLVVYETVEIGSGRADSDELGEPRGSRRFAPIAGHKDGAPSLSRASCAVGAGEQLSILVCRSSGQAAHIRLQDVNIAPGPEPLPPALQPAEAEERAADFASRVLLMAARGKRRRERGRLLRSKPCGYPYWVEYFQRRRNIDFRALDAVSGKKAGAAVRGAIAQGIAAGG